MTWPTPPRPTRTRPVQIRQALQGLIHAANQARASGLAAVPADVAAPLIKEFRHGVILGFGQVKYPGGRKQQPFRRLLERLRDRQDDVLRFVSDVRVPPTSNHAERDLRPAKTQQKISGRLRRATITRHRYAVRGYIDTARKHGVSALTAIRDALAGNPWMPPIPDPTDPGAPAASLSGLCSARAEDCSVWAQLPAVSLLAARGLP